MFIIKHKFIFLIISALLVIASIVVLATKKLNIGIDFTGGSLLEVSYTERPDIERIQNNFTELGYTGSVQPFGEQGVIIRTRDLSEMERQELLGALTVDEQTPKTERFNSIGPSVGKELRSKALISIVFVLLCIVLFISYAFRNIARSNKGQRIGPSPWMYGIYTVVALAHDVIIPAGLFALLGLEINSLFVVGLLSVLGLSVHDTIVVFDRIRERLHHDAEMKLHTPFDLLVGKSITQTMGRSVNTSITIMITLIVLFLVGPESTKGLALIMFVGTFVGIYSSIFVASPLLVWSYKEKKV